MILYTVVTKAETNVAFCKIKHIALIYNEVSIMYCPVTSQVLEVHLHLCFVCRN